MLLRATPLITKCRPLFRSPAVAQLAATRTWPASRVMFWPAASHMFQVRDALLPKLSCDFNPAQTAAWSAGKQPRTISGDFDGMDGEDYLTNAEQGTIVSVWFEFWKLIKPDLLLLLAVSATAVATAFVNITTPRVIGKLVNVLTGALRVGSVVSWSQILFDIRQPALMLLSLFAGQGYLTFLYISLVSVFGERIALRLRAELFSSLIKQDIAFFDGERTGELVNRLTTDVSEFKHSLKLCVSQGLKSFTQVIGSAVQLFSISSQLTTVLILAAPLLYGLGSFYGSYLRLLSKYTKETEGHSSAIASESFSNIRTVRAFANEDAEIVNYNKSLEAVSKAQTKLGYHIGIFQGFTNFSIGGMVLFVLYQGGNLVAREELTGGDLMSYLISIQNAQKSLGTYRLDLSANN